MRDPHAAAIRSAAALLHEAEEELGAARKIVSRLEREQMFLLGGRASRNARAIRDELVEARRTALTARRLVVKVRRKLAHLRTGQ